MAQFDAFPLAGEQHGVIARRAAAAQRRKADMAGHARPGDAVAAPVADRAEIDAASERRGRAQRQRGARWRIDLVAMVQFGNLDIPIRPQRARRIGDKPGEQGHPQAGIGGLEHGNMACRPVDKGVMVGFQPGGADDDRRTALARSIERCRQRRWRGEIDQHGAGMGERPGIGTDGHARRTPRPWRAPDSGMAGTLDRPGDLQMRVLRQRGDDRLPHAAPGAQNAHSGLVMHHAAGVAQCGGLCNRAGTRHCCWPRVRKGLRRLRQEPPADLLRASGGFIKGLRRLGPQAPDPIRSA